MWFGLSVLLLAAGGPADVSAAGDPLRPEPTEPVDPGQPYSLGAEVVPVDPSTLDCSGMITFEDVAGGDPPGTNYDDVFESDGAYFAERFVGQVLDFAGDSDVLSGEPTDPLSPQVGDPNDNLDVVYYEPVDSQVLSGLGFRGFPNFDAIGEGAIAVLFDYDQSEFGFDLLGGDGGDAFVNFFRRDGSLIDMIVLPGLASQTYGFARAGGIRDIAGISIHNLDPAGIGFDNLCHDVKGVPGQPPICDAGGPYAGDVGEPIVFDGSGSYDLDGTITGYAWDFGDTHTGSGVMPTHIYTVAGEFTVELCVTDDDDPPLTTCCETIVTIQPVISVESSPWGRIKATYR
jgi:hypothetical protein